MLVYRSVSFKTWYFCYILQVIFSWEKEKNVDENCCSTTRVCSKWVNSSHCDDLPFFPAIPVVQTRPTHTAYTKKQANVSVHVSQKLWIILAFTNLQVFLGPTKKHKKKNIRGLLLPQARAHARCRRQTSGRTKLNEACGFPPKISQWVVTTVTAGVNWGPFHQLVEFHESGGFPLSIWGEVVVAMKLTPNAMWKRRFLTQDSNPSMFNQPFPKQKNAQQVGKKRGNLLSSLCLLNSKNSQSQGWFVGIPERCNGTLANLRTCQDLRRSYWHQPYRLVVMLKVAAV